MYRAVLIDGAGWCVSQGAIVAVVEALWKPRHQVPHALMCIVLACAVA